MGRQLGFTVFLVDDDADVLVALSRLLATACYETKCFSSAREFLAAHDLTTPGCAVIDVSMDGIDGFDLQEELHAGGAERPVIFLTGRGDISGSVKAMKAGAVDFLTKPVNRDDLLGAIERAAELDERRRLVAGELASINDRVATLTRREREVFQYVVAGRLNKQIATTLGTVEKTIKVHRGRMMAKLGVRCVADLVRLSERIGVSQSEVHRP
jgi:FixJ family two-component response regulator